MATAPSCVGLDLEGDMVVDVFEMRIEVVEGGWEECCVCTQAEEFRVITS